MRDLRTLDLGDADALTREVVELAKNDGKHPVCAVVVGIDGKPLSLRTMDGCPAASVTDALAMCHTVIQTGKPTREFVGIAGFDPANWTDAGMTAFMGGIPIMEDGQMVGALAASGRSGEDNNALVTAAATVFFDNAA
jgi:glc operon protein GlcG